jgi:hypothetical protein
MTRMAVRRSFEPDPSPDAGRSAGADQAYRRADPVPGWSPAAVLALQQHAGNAGATAYLHTAARPVVQRQRAAAVQVPEPLLNDAALAKAHAQYQARRQQYPKTLVQALRTELGIPPGSTIDDTFVQAVAARQDARQLPLTGVLDPGQLSLLLPFGYADSAAIAKSAGRAWNTVALSWHDDDAKDDDQRLMSRAATVDRAVNTWLSMAHLPAITVLPHPDPAGTTAAVYYAYPDKWYMLVRTAVLSDPAAEPATVISLCYHETRHIEQLFQVARLRCRLALGRARGGPDRAKIVDTVARQLQIAKVLVDAAYPLAERDHGGGAADPVGDVIAHAWDDAMQAPGRQAALKRVTNLQRTWHAARDAAEAAPGDAQLATRAAKARTAYDRAVDAYYTRYADERDALRTEHRMAAVVEQFAAHGPGEQWEVEVPP